MRFKKIIHDRSFHVDDDSYKTISQIHLLAHQIVVNQFYRCVIMVPKNLYVKSFQEVVDIKFIAITIFLETTREECSVTRSMRSESINNKEYPSVCFGMRTTSFVCLRSNDEICFL